MVFLNVNIDEDLLKKAKAKSAMIGIDLKTYISRLIETNTQNISLEDFQNGDSK